MTLVAVVKTLLYRYTGQEDLIVGFPIAGRNHAGLEAQIGFYVNTLPLRIQVRQACRSTNCWITSKQHAAKLTNTRSIRSTGSSTSWGWHATSAAIRCLTSWWRCNTKLQNRLSLDGASASGFIQDYEGSKYDMHFAFDLNDAMLEASIVYNTDLFRPDRINRMGRHLIELARNVLADPQQTVQGVDILTDAERHQLLVAWNGPTSDYPRQVHSSIV